MRGGVRPCGGGAEMVCLPFLCLTVPMKPDHLHHHESGTSTGMEASVNAKAVSYGKDLMTHEA